MAVAVFIPFTVAHGPTSANLNREVLGWGMDRWGWLMGSIPPLLVGAGLWRVRNTVAGGRRVANRALVVLCVALYLFAAMTILGGSLGPPFEIVLLAPASVVAAAMTSHRGAIRMTLAGIATAYGGALALQLLPLQVLDSFGGFRIFGLLEYAGAGALWAALGAVLLRNHYRSDSPT